MRLENSSHSCEEGRNLAIQLSEHFNYRKLFRFTLPSILMMIFTSIYGVVDGFFVSNYVGKSPFAAVNLIMPFLMILGAAGFMFGTGGCALISKTMGEGNAEKANKIFSLLIVTSVIFGVAVAVLGILFIRPIAALLGAQGELLENCVIYGRIILAALPAFILQYEFQSFFVAAEKPQLGLIFTIAAGLTNMLLDALLVAVIPLGLVGAALATAMGQAVGGILPLLYFARNNSNQLKLVKPVFDGMALFRTCINGSSELMTNISLSIVSMLYNAQLMRYAGEDGVAAYGVLMYVSMIFQAIFFGYIVGSAPIISYHFGAQNHDELKNLLKRSAVIIVSCSVGMFLLAEFLAKPLAMLFVGYDAELMKLTLRAFLIFSFSFLFSGVAVFGSGFFTALNDGLTSALISFLRTMVFQIAAVIILPMLFAIDGIWFSIVFAEAAATVVTLAFLLGKRNKYRYF